MKRRRSERLDKLGIFRTKSFLERVNSEKATGIEKVGAVDEVSNSLSKASGDLLKNFQAVGKSLGNGAFADVFLF